MTLHFYSPKVYKYVRQKFCSALPDSSALRSWYSTINCEPSFTSESFDALKKRVSEEKKVGKQVIVALMLDEISIKKGIQYLRDGKLRGYVDVGSGIETCDDIPLAKDALVFIAVVIDDSWKIPLGYFLVNGIDTSVNAGLIRNCLQRLDEIGVEVVSLTLDGPSQHFATVRELGATFDFIDPKPFFLHPSNKKKVNVIFDACHMLKLFRNCLGDIKELHDSEGKKIEWRFITTLAYLQEQKGLRAGNRLKIAHIQYWKMKIKVALAAQTLSSSVADAIEFCARDLGLSEFQGSEAMVRFIRCIDRLFDFLNSRNPFGKGFKAPLRPTNEFIWRPQILAELEYLKGIRNVEGKLM
ncbi:THAP domain-containing protein [Ooceraea biroi]|uniref:THAP domain-containing protein n=1 Tax=Ooceraea biroi TaxID=2015173 RepID=A0A026VUN6_OOCBI|nr:THAP domain-containing protein [Ooceraea biroi]